MKIKKVRLKNYKSIKDGEFEASDFNILIGKNNSGKSAILDAIRSYSNNRIKRNEVYGKDESKETKIEVTFELSESEIEQIANNLEDTIKREDLEKISVFREEIKYSYSSQKIEQKIEYIKYEGQFIPIRNFNSDQRRARRIKWSVFPETKYTKVNKNRDTAFKQVIKQKLHTLDHLEAFREAEDIRNINYSDSLQNSGENLTNTFDTIYRNQPEKFEQIKEEFVNIMEGVTDLRSIMTQNNRTTIFVDEKIVDEGFRLNEISSGSKQILILITKLVLSQDKRDFLLLEEPELHLHPEAQKQIFRLIERISEKRPQIFTTTHSKEFIEESKSSNVVKIDRKISSELHSVADGEIEKEFQDLGYERGDLLQSNAVILVEGRSDKLILKELARTLERDLEEYGISVIELEGKENMKRDGRSLVKLLYSFNIPYLFLIDKDNHNSKEAAEGEIVNAIKRNDDKGWWDTEWENFRSLEKYSIESYLTNKNAIAKELDEDPNKIEDELKDYSNIEDKSAVLQNIYEEFLDLDYKKDRDGLKLAKRLNKENIEDEIKEIIESVIEKSKS